MLMHLLHILCFLAVWTAGLTPAEATQAPPHLEDTAAQHATALSKEGLIAAVLTESPQPFRYSNTRSQRLLPVHGSKPNRHTGKITCFYKFSNLLYPRYGGLLRSEATPFPSVVPRWYYILALGRLLC